jgi:hypothetical protein
MAIERAPANKIDERYFEVVPVPLNFCVHLQLLDVAAAVDVVGEGVAPSVRVRGDEVPSDETKSQAAEKKVKKEKVTHCSPMMGVTSMSNLQKRTNNHIQNHFSGF